MAAARIDLIGCGGLGGEVGHGLVRKGVGHLTLIDFDAVETSNLPRQHFYQEDVGRAKAHALAHNLARQATGRTTLEGHAQAFQTQTGHPSWAPGDLAVVGVDNHPTRLAVAEAYRARGIPVLFLAVDRRASRGYVFVQTSQPGDPCFLCLFPDARRDRRVHGCAGASIEILKAVAGIALYAIDSLLMPRPRPWNYKTIFLDGADDATRRVGPRPNCPLCAAQAAASAA